MPSQVSCVVENAVAIVTIDNPARLNAIDLPMAEGLVEVTATLGRRDDLSVAVFRGAGLKAFSAGADLKAVAESGDREGTFAAIDRAMQQVESNIGALPVPSVAMLSGVCYGGGVLLAALMDFRLASSDLRLAVPAIPNRLFYPVPALERLAALMGWASTRRLIYDAGPHDAETLLRWGLIDRIASPAQIESATIAFARRLAEKPREIMRDYKPIFAALQRGDRKTAERLRRDAEAREAARRRG
jgi:enoyl-CoA hydratase